MKYALAAAAVAALIAGPALAQGTPALDSFELQGTVAVSCVATQNFTDPRAIAITPGAVTAGGSITYACNAANGFTRTISSANNGNLRRNGNLTGAGNEVAYTIQHGGGSGLAIAAGTSLASPITTSLGGSTAFITGQTGSFNATLPASLPPLFAGSYSDVITVAVTPNT